MSSDEQFVRVVFELVVPKAGGSDVEPFPSHQVQDAAQGVRSAQSSARLRIRRHRNRSHAARFAADDVREAHRAEILLLFPRRSMSRLIDSAFHFHLHLRVFFFQILDEVYTILECLKVTTKLARPFKLDELFDLSTMAMEYFKEHMEPNLPEITYFGTDFFDLTGTFSRKCFKFLSFIFFI